MTSTEKRIEAASEKLQQADSATRTIEDASRSIGALIIACGYLLEIVAEQDRRIEELREQLELREPLSADEVERRAIQRSSDPLLEHLRKELKK